MSVFKGVLIVVIVVLLYKLFVGEYFNNASDNSNSGDLDTANITRPSDKELDDFMLMHISSTSDHCNCDSIEGFSLSKKPMYHRWHMHLRNPWDNVDYKTPHFYKIHVDKSRRIPYR